MHSIGLLVWPNLQQHRSVFFQIMPNQTRVSIIIRPITMFGSC